MPTIKEINKSIKLIERLIKYEENERARYNKAAWRLEHFLSEPLIKRVQTIYEKRLKYIDKADYRIRKRLEKYKIELKKLQQQYRNLSKN
ncbi:MAG TPA: hypothetical protein VNX68_08945 [Nitrosopumilaceae archaeon]|jgi:hypothetical protein|nr:hypothetical protein [Nitrosopumilaceae archaeon]